METSVNHNAGLGFLLCKKWENESFMPSTYSVRLWQTRARARSPAGAAGVAGLPLSNGIARRRGSAHAVAGQLAQAERQEQVELIISCINFEVVHYHTEMGYVQGHTPQIRKY